MSLSRVLPLLALSLLVPSPASAQDDWKVGRSRFNPAMIARYKGMLSSDPADEMAYRKLVSLYSSYSFVGRLIREYERTVRQHPRAYAARVVLARLYLERGRVTEAETLLKEAATLRPDRYSAHLILARLYAKASKDREALREYDQALRHARKGRVFVRKLLKEVISYCLLRRRYEDALKYVARLKKVVPDSWDVSMQYAEILVDVMEYDRALEEYKKLLARAGGNTFRRIEVHKKMALVYEKKGDAASAERHYWKAYRLASPGSWYRREVVQRLVSAARKMGTLAALYAKMRRMWRRPRPYQAIVLSRMADELGRMEEARRILRAAAARHPDSPEVLEELLSLLRRRFPSEHKAMLRVLRTLTRLLPWKVEYRIEIIRLYQKMGNEAEARRQARALEDKGRNDASTIARLVDLYKEWGDMAKVMELLKKLISLEPYDPEHRIALAHLYWMVGRRADAERLLASVIRARLCASMDECYAMVAEAYSTVRAYSKAYAMITKAIASAPSPRKKAEYMLVKVSLQVRMRHPLSRIESTLSKLFDIAKRSGDAYLLKRVEDRKLKVWNTFGVLDERLAALEATWKGDLETGLFLGRGYVMSGAYGSAERIYKRLHAIYPNLGEPVLGLLRVYRLAGENAKVIELLPLALKLVPERRSEIYRMGANAYAEMGRLRESMALLHKSAMEGTSDPLTLIRIARLSYKLGDLDGAVRAYEQAISLAPSEMGYRFEYARQLERMGRFRKAAEQYHAILRVTSSDEDRADALQRLFTLALMTKGLKDFERFLHAMTFEYPEKKIYGEWLSRLYLVYVPLVFNTKEYKLSDAERARLAARATAPLVSMVQKASGPRRLVPVLRVLTMLGIQAALEPVLRKMDEMKDGLGQGLVSAVVQYVRSLRWSRRVRRILWNHLNSKWKNGMDAYYRFSLALILMEHDPSLIIKWKNSTVHEKRLAALLAMARKGDRSLKQYVGDMPWLCALIPCPLGKNTPLEEVLEKGRWTPIPDFQLRRVLEYYLLTGRGIDVLRRYAAARVRFDMATQWVKSGDAGRIPVIRPRIMITRHRATKMARLRDAAFAVAEELLSRARPSDGAVVEGILVRLRRLEVLGNSGALGDRWRKIGQIVREKLMGDGSLRGLVHPWVVAMLTHPSWAPQAIAMVPAPQVRDVLETLLAWGGHLPGAVVETEGFLTLGREEQELAYLLAIRDPGIPEPLLWKALSSPYPRVAASAARRLCGMRLSPSQRARLCAESGLGCPATSGASPAGSPPRSQTRR